MARWCLPIVFALLVAVGCSDASPGDADAVASSSSSTLESTTSSTSATSSTGGSSTTTSLPAESSTTTSTVAATTRPTPPDPDAEYSATPGLFPPPPIAGSERARGSGCAPGEGPLPDGVWFGLIPRKDVGSVDFDLACFYFGDVAYEIGRERDEEVNNDYIIVNDNPLLRTVPLHPSAIAWTIPYELTTLEPVAADGAWPPPDEDVGFGLCPGPFCIAWLYVNDGVVTEIVEQYVP